MEIIMKQLENYINLTNQNFPSLILMMTQSVLGTGTTSTADWTVM